MRLPPNAKKWQSIAVVAKHPNSIYALAAASRQPLEIIQAPTYGYDNLETYCERADARYAWFQSSSFFCPVIDLCYSELY